MKRLLFICSRNQWRSPTAEAIYRDDPRVEVRSAGLSSSARRRVTDQMLLWADLIFVMESKHKSRLHEAFPSISSDLEIQALDIPDDYTFMPPELVQLLRDGIEPFIG